MKGIEILAIGNEVLAGLTVNSNASWLAKRLFDEAFPVMDHLVLPDREDILLERLKESVEKADFVIATGGLGPTLDDITVDIAKKLFGEPELIPNTVGSAPGLLYDKIVFLPGVPLEMKEMFTLSVLPHLKKKFSKTERKVRERINLCLLPERAVDPELRRLHALYPEVDFGIYPQAGVLNVTLTATDKSLIEAPLQALKEKFKANLFESSTGKIDEAVFQLLLKKGKTLSVAESMTGGTVARRLTLNPGVSQVFLGGVVAYSNASKTQLLQVDKKIIEEKGAVSEEVAKGMAEGVLKAFDSDFSLSITGVAGPGGGTPDKPIGMAWCALANKKGPTQSWQIKGWTSSRSMIMEYGTLNLLSHLYLYLQSEATDAN